MNNYLRGPFDPVALHYKGPVPIDALVDAVPVMEVVSLRSTRTARRFAMTPMDGFVLFPPTARVLLLLQYLGCMCRVDADGGWYRLSAGRVEDAGLKDRHIRRRALQSLEADKVIEVCRRGNKSPLIRIAPSAAVKLQWNPRSKTVTKSKQTKSLSRVMHILDVDTGQTIKWAVE